MGRGFESLPRYHPNVQTIPVKAQAILGRSRLSPEFHP